MPLESASRLGLSMFADMPPMKWNPGLSGEDAEVFIRAVYQQVLGNAYVMASERLTVVESQFKRGELTVRDLVRAVAKSDLYRSRFFSNCPTFRAIELNFRHLLGRAPEGLEEVQSHTAILDSQGFEADIDSYIDSDEYQRVFGDDIVPYIRGYKSEACNSVVQFTHTFQLVRGSASSSLRGDASGIRPKLNGMMINSTPAPVTPLNTSFSSRGATTRQGPGGNVGEDGKLYRIEATTFRAKRVTPGTRLQRGNRIFLVPYNQLSETYQRIHKQGGVIASITPV